jgi:hypothetical protein
MNVKTMSVATMATLLMSGAALSTAFADTATTQVNVSGQVGDMGMHLGKGRGNPIRPGVMGTVSSISGSSLVISSKDAATQGNSTATATTFTVNAAAATVIKNGATTTLSGIAVGDTVMVEGTITGTTVVAKTIRDGAGMMMEKGGMMGKRNEASSTMAMMQGNGQPVVAGTIASISGNSVILSTKTNLSYTIDVTSAKVLKMGAASSVATLTTGDFVVVQGAINGTAVVATTVMDQGAAKQPPANGNSQGPKGAGFMGGIGNFFKHLFGF